MNNNPLEELEDELKRAGFKEIEQSELPPAFRELIDSLLSPSSIESKIERLKKEAASEGTDYVEGHIQAALADIIRQIRTDGEPAEKNLDDINYLRGYYRALQGCHASIQMIRDIVELHFWSHCAMDATKRLMDKADPFREMENVIKCD